MTITIEIPPDLEARLRERASEKDNEEIRRLLAEAVAPTVESILNDSSAASVRLGNGLTLEEFDALVAELDRMPGSGVSLSDEDLGRESIYEDCPER